MFYFDISMYPVRQSSQIIEYNFLGGFENRKKSQSIFSLDPSMEIISDDNEFQLEEEEKKL